MSFFYFVLQNAQKSRNINDVLFGILLLNILVDFAPHLFEMGLHHIVVNKNVVLVGHGRRI